MGNAGSRAHPDGQVTRDTESVLGRWPPTFPFFYKLRTAVSAVAPRHGGGGLVPDPPWAPKPEDGTARAHVLPGMRTRAGHARGRPSVWAQPRARRVANPVSAFRNFLGFFAPNTLRDTTHAGAGGRAGGTR